MILRSCTILIFWLAAFGVRAQDLPVLPLPVHVETDSGETLQWTSIQTLLYPAVDAAAAARLQEHWNAFKKSSAASQPSLSVQLGLLTRDSAFNNRIAGPLAQWRSAIGTEGYILIINKNQCVLAANTETGLFYGMQTLKQLIRAGWQKPVLIADYPSFAHRAVYDDISRGPVSTVAYIKQQIERLAELKINALSFYIEHVVQPVSYPDFAPANGKLTIPQIKELSAYAARYHMQLVGSFQSFGHFEKILSLPRYRSMGETSTLISPLDSNARHFLKSVIGELCDAFSAPYFNVNCDETFDLGKGKSKAWVDSIGPARYYADHIRFLYDVVKQHNKRMMMWGDIALSHEEILDMLPRDIVYLTWEYGSQPSFDHWIAPFRRRGLEYMVCPGILNSYRLLPDMAMATANIDGFLEEGKEKGASGVVTTVWDDGGAYLFSGDWYGVYKAADKSWNTNSKDRASFDTRYTVTAYGVTDQSYVQALFTMMQLRRLPLTYNLNDNVWNQKLLPDSGRQLILNNTDTDTAIAIINRAAQYIGKAKAKRNGTDIQTLQMSISQYRLIMQGRKLMPHIAEVYQTASAQQITKPSEATALLSKAATDIGNLENQYKKLENSFRNAWLRENQPYSLDIASAPFDTRIKDLHRLRERLSSTANAAGAHKLTSFAPRQSLRLDIVQNGYTYFQNWLLTGPFTLDTNGSYPGFLYAGDVQKEDPPKPGDLFSFRQTTYRWKKYASPNGGMTELDDFYAAGHGKLAYAYCTVTTDKALTADAFVTAANGMDVYANGKQVLHRPYTEQAEKQEQKVSLSLKAGINYLLFKIPAGTDAWSFAFRLDPQLIVTNQKYKYFINTEKGNHEAE
ncbi:MAG: family 20 glycosylhydrolase [Bacteroidetes bacterium]|nr:family 20 glycosylhydrolase [Bacteroidota bacterium]